MSTMDGLESALLNFVKSQGSYQYFFIPGRPIPQARARTIAKAGRVWSYTPGTTKQHRDDIVRHLMAGGIKRVLPPYTLCLKFALPRLKTVYEAYPTSKSHGDLDNLEKAVLDALFKKDGLLEDDAHVVSVIKCKRLANRPEEVGTHIWLINGVPCVDEHVL